MTCFSSQIEDYNKEMFLKFQHIQQDSKENYKFGLNIIRQCENKNKCCIFKLDNSRIKDFILNRKLGSIRKISSIISKYYDYYKENIDDTINDKLCNSFKNKELLKELYQKELKTYFLSMTELINNLALINVDKNAYAISILLYMGIDTTKISKLQVSNIDFEKKEIKISNLKYSNINKHVFDIIVSNIKDKNNMEEHIIKVKSYAKLTGSYITNIAYKSNRLAAKYKILKNLNSKSLRDAGSLTYYYTHEDKFNREDTDIQKLKLYKAFGMMTKISSSRFSLCNTDLNFKIDVIKTNTKYKESMFDVDIDVTEQEIKEIRINSRLGTVENSKEAKSLLDEMKEIYPEDERGENDDQVYINKKRIGNEGEALVKRILEDNEYITDIKLMKDYTGYDIQFRLGSKIHRIEVKAINKKFEFYITLNELNNLYNYNRENFVMGFVVGKDVKILNDVENNLGLDRKFIYKFLKNENIQMVSENFKVRLNTKLFKQLGNIKSYLNNL